MPSFFGSPSPFQCLPVWTVHAFLTILDRGHPADIFFHTLISAMIGIGLIGISFSGYWFKNVTIYQRWYLGVNSLFFIAPGIESSILGLFLISPILFLQLKK